MQIPTPLDRSHSLSHHHLQLDFHLYHPSTMQYVPVLVTLMLLARHQVMQVRYGLTNIPAGITTMVATSSTSNQAHAAVD